MKLEIITPDKKLYEGKVKLVQVPGSKGSFEILKNHAPIISTLNAGNIKVVDEKDVTTFFKVTGGLVEVKGHDVVILAD
jgi:F-type H+-transporting ATPase subunit epsilon